MPKRSHFIKKNSRKQRKGLQVPPMRSAQSASAYIPSVYKAQTPVLPYLIRIY